MRRRPKQLSLNARFYRVDCGRFGEIEIQAATPAAAMYQIFKKAREAGFFYRPSGFRDFLAEGWKAREIVR